MLLENNPFPQDGRVRREAQTLANAGYAITVISPRARGKQQPYHEVWDGIRVYRYPAPPEFDGVLGYGLEYGWSLVAAFVLVLYMFVRHGFDVIHAHNPPDLYFLIAAPYKLIGKKFVFDHHDLSPEMYDARSDGEGSGLVRRILVWAERMTCKMADHIIVTNESYRAINATRSNVPDARMTTVRNGPDLAREAVVEPDPETVHPGKCVIGYAGVMGQQDGADYLLQALGHLIHQINYSNFHAVLIGAGDALGDIKALAEKLGITKHVTFTGWVESERVGALLAAADICVAPEPSNPYNDRSTMIKITEYMAAGKPIVAFDLPEHRQTAGDAALYAPANDPTEMAKAIHALIDDPDKRAEMGRLGRSRIETGLAWSFQAEKLLAAYESLWQQVT